jgi:hypothetical protein
VAFLGCSRVVARQKSEAGDITDDATMPISCEGFTAIVVAMMERTSECANVSHYLHLIYPHLN